MKETYVLQIKLFYQLSVTTTKACSILYIFLLFEEEYILYHVASYIVTTNTQKIKNITDPEVYLIASYKEILLYLPKSLWTATICEVKQFKKFLTHNLLFCAVFQNALCSFYELDKFTTCRD